MIHMKTITILVENYQSPITTLMKCSVFVDYEDNGYHLFQYQKNIIDFLSVYVNQSKIYEDPKFSIIEFNDKQAW